MITLALQGHGDSLCGVYALLNVIKSFEDSKENSITRDREIFAQIILAAERLGYLDYHHVTVGFEAFELIEMLNWVSERFCYDLIAENISRFCTKLSHQSNLAEAALSAGRAIVVYNSTAEHWVALSPSSEELMDSWPHGSLVKVSEAKASDYGLTIKRVSEVE